MKDLCRIWGVNQSRTTPNHPQGNGVVEENNRMLGDALRSLFVERSQEEWDVMLPQIMRAYRSTPHASTQETSNLLVLGRETRVPEHLTYLVPAPKFPVHEYIRKVMEMMRKALEALREKWAVRKEDSEDLPLYREGDWVWMVSYYRHRGQFVGLYCVIEVLPNQTYRSLSKANSS